MSEYWALLWTVKPGSEETVRELFRNYSPPDPVVTDEEGNEKGRLVGTQVFMKDNTIVRVLEIEGALPDVAAHLSRQPAIQALEQELDKYVEKPRDMSEPGGAQKFFVQSLMDCLVARRDPD